MPALWKIDEAVAILCRTIGGGWQINQKQMFNIVLLIFQTTVGVTPFTFGYSNLNWCNRERYGYCIVSVVDYSAIPRIVIFLQSLSVSCYRKIYNEKRKTCDWCWDLFAHSPWATLAEHWFTVERHYILFVASFQWPIYCTSPPPL